MIFLLLLLPGAIPSKSLICITSTLFHLYVTFFPFVRSFIYIVCLQIKKLLVHKAIAIYFKQKLKKNTD